MKYLQSVQLLTQFTNNFVKGEQCLLISAEGEMFPCKICDRLFGNDFNRKQHELVKLSCLKLDVYFYFRFKSISKVGLRFLESVLTLRW